MCTIGVNNPGWQLDIWEGGSTLNKKIMNPPSYDYIVNSGCTRRIIFNQIMLEKKRCKQSGFGPSLSCVIQAGLLFSMEQSMNWL